VGFSSNFGFSSSCFLEGKLFSVVAVVAGNNFTGSLSLGKKPGVSLFANIE
jgi:hypothetical protein